LSRRRDVLIASIAVAAVAAFAAAAAIGVVQEDLAAYWVAGAVRRLGLDPYVNHAVGGTVPEALWDGSIFHHSRFIYPPLAAELFRPLGALPYRAAKVVFTFAIVAAWIAASRLLAPGRRAGAALLAAGALFFPLWLGIERGQIDLLLLLLIALAWRARERALVAGALFALAAVFKPALLVAVPVIAALGRWRWAAAIAGWCVAAALATVAVSGPTLVRTYAVSVLPRTILYGSGGTDDMAYHERAFERFYVDEHGEWQSVDGHPYRDWLPVFDRPVSASIPRLLAPETPSWPTTVPPVLAASAALIWAARRRARTQADDDGGERLLLAAALIACVVTSPTGWTMGLVWALPIAPLVWTAAPDRWARATRWSLRGAWIACAVPAPFVGWGALAGTALAVAAGRAALERERRA